MEFATSLEAGLGDGGRTLALVPDQDVESLRERFMNTEWQLRTLVEGMPQLVWRSCDMGNWTWASPQWLEFTGQTQEQTHGRGWMDAVHPDDHAAALEAWASARPHGMLDVEFRVRRISDGNYVWHRTRSAPVRDRDGRIVEWLGTTTDIQDLKSLQEQQAKLLAEAQHHARHLEAEVQERKRAEDKLLFTAFHDDLTKLHNRAFFMGQLRRALAERGLSPVRRSAILILDLDRFKLVNDSLGHGAGDVLLTIIGKRLRKCLDTGVTLARIGGDEFGILAEAIDEAALERIAACVLSEVHRPAWLGRRQIVSSCSIGAAWMDERHRTAEAVLQAADIAMYEAKRQHNGHFRIFENAMLARAAETLDLRTDLRQAVARSELELHYQPIWDTATKALTGFEALVRWQSPRLGLLQPGAFIPAAEEAGLIRDIGRWVLREGCRQMGAWDESHKASVLTLHVNVCGEELKDPDFVPEIEAALVSARIRPERLELEITEGIFLEDSDAVRQTLANLRTMGIRIAIDDFGTGYSSLSYLDRHEVDTVKIDRSFVARMLRETRTKTVMEAVVNLGQALSLRVVAEGVESEDERDALTAMRCDAVQGYLLGRPAPAASWTGLLEASRNPTPHKHTKVAE